MASFGRSSDSDIKIPMPQLSGMHGELFVEQGALILRDLGSKNGLCVNGKPIDEVTLQDGDVVSVGRNPIFAVSSEAQSQALAIAEPPSVVALPQKKEEAPEAKPKSSPLIPIAVGVTVLVVLLSFDFSTSEAPDKASPVHDQKTYLSHLDRSVALFRSKEYPSQEKLLQEAIEGYAQNGTAHILLDLNDIWSKKGDRYETLSWGRAKTLCRELLSSHPSTDTVSQLARDLLDWIGKEEKVMPMIQQILREHRQSPGARKAIDLMARLPANSSIVKVYREDLDQITASRGTGLRVQLDRELASENWSRAINTLSDLKNEGHELAEDAKLLLQLESNIRDHIAIRQARRTVSSDPGNVSVLLADIRDDSPYHLRARDLRNQAQKSLSVNRVLSLYRQGLALEAVQLNRELDVMGAAFSSKALKVKALYETIQKGLKGPAPEASVKDMKTFLDLEKDPKHLWVKEVRRHHQTWTDPEHLSGLAYQKGKVAEEQGMFPTARQYFERANDLAPGTASEELQSMEKKAWMHFNRAMSFHAKGDPINTRTYLNRSLELTAKNSKLYDRIEAFLRSQP